MVRFRDGAVEAEYQADKRNRLATADMRSAVFFALLWAHDVWRFLGQSPLGLLKATVWLAAVGMKPVYVYLIVGKEFYLQYRAWIVTFTKTVFATHPPGEHLHLQMLQAATSAPASLPSLLWVLANGMHLPYMLITGLGWQDAVYNIPMQLALVGRAYRDNQAQCAAPFFRTPQAQALLRGLADRLTSALSTSLYLVGVGTRGHQAAFPASLDPCTALGTWAALCFGLLFTTLVLAASERRARTKFARRNSARLSDSERQLWREGDDGWGLWAATGLILAYTCLLAWQALISLFAWSSGQPLAWPPGANPSAEATQTSG